MKAAPKSLNGRTSVDAVCKPKARLRPRSTKQFVQVFKALADETRLEIIGLLAGSQAELCVCDVERHFALSQATISHHLKVLREAGLLTSTRRGTWIYYALDRKSLSSLEEFKTLAGG